MSPKGLRISGKMVISSERRAQQESTGKLELEGMVLTI